MDHDSAEVGKFRDTMDEVVRRLIVGGFASLESIQGCSPGEVQAVSRLWGVALPDAYVAFLLRMGRGAGRFYLGSDVYYPKVLELKEGTAELLRAAPDTIRYNSSSVTFGMHQGYEILYFEASRHPDPPVYRYTEGEVEARLVEDSLTSLLLGGALGPW